MVIVISDTHGAYIQASISIANRSNNINTEKNGQRNSKGVKVHRHQDNVRKRTQTEDKDEKIDTGYRYMMPTEG